MKTYSAKTLVACYRAAREGYCIETGEWTKPHLDPSEFRQWFRDCLERKINAHDPRYPTGRKAQEEYQTELGRMRQLIGNRLIVEWIASVLGARVRAAMSHRMRESI
jgi:hypothetical protein